MLKIYNLVSWHDRYLLYYKTHSLLKMSNKNISEIIPGKLYLGNRFAARNVPSTGYFDHDNNPIIITHVLNVTLELPCYMKSKICYSASGDPTFFIKYNRIRMIDVSIFPIGWYLDEASEFINKSILDGGVVLVHCYVGKSRSATNLMAYLIRYNGLSVADALKLVQEKRLIAKPNRGFMFQLKRFAKRHNTKQ